MKTNFPFKSVLVLLIAFLLYNCSKEEIIPSDVEKNNFVWGGMNAYYKWQGEVEDLADTKFSTRAQLNEFLEGFEEPEDLFNSLLNTDVDDCSWITDNFETIEDAFAGIKNTTGMKVNGMTAKDSNDFYLYVYDVIAGSNAEFQGVTRGMIITEIDGVRLSLNNVEGLLSRDSFTISLAAYNGGNPEIPFDDPNITTDDTVFIRLTKSIIQENPITINKVFQVGGQRIGYVMYNNFVPAFDGELNNVFGSFRASSLDDLIVDLRYNGSGSVESATYLASMITGQFNNEPFSKQIWNDKVMSNVINENVTNFFTDEIDNGSIEQDINSLGLSKVYFIVSDATANASEVLINGLKAYPSIDVQLIGAQTLGLTEASLTVYDSDDYTKNGENFNESHEYAMQLVALEVQNSINVNEPNGFTVDFSQPEDSGNLGVLGEVSDPLLSQAIEFVVSGSATLIEGTTPVPTQNTWNSNMLFLDYNKMYVTLNN